MTIRCQCHVISEASFTEAIREHRDTISDMPLNKAAAYIFNQVRGEMKADGAVSESAGKHCPRPCVTALQILINEIEAADPPQTPRGYPSPEDHTGAALVSAMLMEMK